MIAHEAIAEQLTERLAEAIRSNAVGQAERYEVDVPPVIERDAAERVDRYREAPRRRDGSSRLAAGSCRRTARFLPTALVGIAPGRAVLREEVFGPLLTIEPAAGVGEACDRVEALPFALTGGLFARNPDAR